MKAKYQNKKSLSSPLSSTAAKLPALLATIAVAHVASGCSGDEIDRARFTQDVCTQGQYLPLQRIHPAAGIDSVQLRSNNGDPNAAPTVIDTFGVPCAKAADMTACQAAIVALHDPNKGWNTGSFFPELHYTVTTSGDMVASQTTIEEAKAVLGTIDTPEEAAFVVTATGRSYVNCGGNAHALPDGSFELLVQHGSGCGEGDDKVLEVVVVKSDGTSQVTETEVLEEGDPNCVIGRLTEGLAKAPGGGEDLGAFFARMAYLEGAAVFAFERLSRELEAHDAPARLVDAARRSMREETRHARSVGKLARRFGAEPEEAAGDVLSVRGLLEIAVENAAEGCVRETFGALVAVVQAQAARDPEIARVMRGIARDETRHAQLSWEVAAWAKMKLDGAGRERVDRAMMEAVTKLRRDLETPVCREALAHAGFPAPTQAIALFERLAQQIWKKN